MILGTARGAFLMGALLAGCMLLWLVSLGSFAPETSDQSDPIGKIESPESSFSQVPTRAPGKLIATKVSILDRWNGQPLPGATIRLLDGRGELVKKESADSQGTFLISANLARSFEIQAPGYCDMESSITPATGETPIHLFPSGELILQFVDADGAPVAGVAANLVPPKVQELPRSGRESRKPRRSSMDGMIRWEKIPALPEYRWKLRSMHPVVMNPPVESAGYEIEGTGVRPRTLQEGTSAPFQVTPGNSTTWIVKVHTKNKISGQIQTEGSGFAQLPILSIYDIQEFRHPGGTMVQSIREEAWFQADESGFFSKEGIRPGRKLLRASWKEAGENFFFGQREFRLKEKESIDLGSLVPIQGEPAVGQVNVVDRDGLLWNPAALFPPDSRLQVMLTVFEQEPSGGREQAFAKWFVVPVNEPFVLNGMGQGQWSFQAETYSWPEPNEGIRAVRTLDESNVSFPAHSDVNLSFQYDWVP